MPIIILFWLYGILRFDSTVVINVLIIISCIRSNNQILEKFKVHCMYMFLSLPQHLKVNYFANLPSEKWQKVHGGSTSPQCKASMRFVSWNWKWARHFWNMLYQILQTNYLDLSVCFLLLYMNMLCIPHLNWKCRKLVCQNKVKICKL